MSASETEDPATAGINNNGEGISKAKRFQLADLLRDCAALVEQNEFDQKTFQAMFREMTMYVQSQGASEQFSPPTEQASTNSIPATSSDSSMNNRPADPPGATTARRVTTTTTTHVPPPAASTSSRSENHEESALSNHKNHNFLGKLKSTMKDVGHEFSQISHGARQSSAAKQATSRKNAHRVQEDLRSQLGQENAGKDQSETHSEGGSHNHTASSTPRANPSRPPFQRPVNPNSTLIANGWMEQQRRSKMRTVWKEVLVSLVAGRRPGEETTLWVQKQIQNSTTGKTELEALHQIPVKGMQDINYVDFSSDHRFVIQVYNLSDQFTFRTPGNGEAAKSWVSTLRLTRDAVMNGIPPPRGADLNAADHRTKQHPDAEDEKKADSPPDHQRHQYQHEQPQTSRKLSVSDLRAIAHGHGINTHGMEKGELERVVAQIQQQNHQGFPRPHPPSGPPPPSAQKQPAYPGPPPHARSSSDFTSSSEQDDRRRHEEESSRREAERLQREEEQRAAEERARQMKTDQQAAARMAAEERERAETERRRAEAERQKRAQAQAEEQRRQQQQHAEHLRRQQQEAENRRRWEEEQRRRAQQQQQWQEEQRRRAYAQQQQQQQQQWQGQHPRAPPPGPGFPQQHPQHPHQARYQQPQPPRQQTPPPGHGGHPNQAPPQGQRPGPPPNANAAGSSPVNQKWVNMAAEEESSGQPKTQTIKHNILISWALQPPTLQMLRPLADLITTVQTVFPPTTGVPGHEYFQKWRAYSMADISEGGRPTEAKLAKAVKKLRFFLHPDKLPRDLNEEQTFVCKMVWDIINDANEEYEKRKEDLDWLNPSSSS